MKGAALGFAAGAAGCTGLYVTEPASSPGARVRAGLECAALVPFCLGHGVGEGFSKARGNGGACVEGCRSSWGPGAPLLRAAPLLFATLEAPQAQGPAGWNACHRLAWLLRLFAAAGGGRGAGSNEQSCMCLGEQGGLGARDGMAPRPAAAPRCALAPFRSFCGCFL